MKLLLLFALATPTAPLKPWTHDMCQVRQKYATDEYIAYCKYESPNKHPSLCRRRQDRAGQRGTSSPGDQGRRQLGAQYSSTTTAPGIPAGSDPANREDLIRILRRAWYS